MVRYDSLREEHSCHEKDLSFSRISLFSFIRISMGEWLVIFAKDVISQDDQMKFRKGGRSKGLLTVLNKGTFSDTINIFVQIRGM